MEISVAFQYGKGHENLKVARANVPEDDDVLPIEVLAAFVATEFQLLNDEGEMDPSNFGIGWAKFDEDGNIQEPEFAVTGLEGILWMVTEMPDMLESFHEKMDAREAQ